jgi:hypothetical protein
MSLAMKLPVFYLVSSSRAEDLFAGQIVRDGRRVLRADLSAIGVSRTPTVMAVNRAGRIIAIRIGSVFPGSPEDARCSAELLSGTSHPLYMRITNAELPRYVAGKTRYQIIELHQAPTPLPPGLQYRQIPPGELSVRAAHEIPRDNTVFVDCNTVKSPLVCQNALLILSSIWAPDNLVAVNLPKRGGRQ